MRKMITIIVGILSPFVEIVITLILAYCIINLIQYVGIYQERIYQLNKENEREIEMKFNDKGEE